MLAPQVSWLGSVLTMAGAPPRPSGIPRRMQGNPVRAVAHPLVPVLGDSARADRGAGGSRRRSAATKEMTPTARSEWPARGRRASARWRRFSAMAAHCLLGRRSLLQYAAKEASRPVAAPHAGDMEKVLRIAQYLVGERRTLVQWSPFGRDDGVIHAVGLRLGLIFEDPEVHRGGSSDWPIHD